MQIKINIPDYWPKLSIGDYVSIISPSFAVKDDEILKIKLLLKDWGLNIHIGDFNKNNEPLFANSDKHRKAELNNAVNHPESKFILTTRGGYGCSKIIDQFSFNNKFKIIAGFSDLTSLHLLINNYLNKSSLHSPVLKQIANNEIDNRSVELFKNIIFGNIKELFYDVKQINNIKLKSNLLPRLIGGNLSLIQTSIGTKWQINNKPFCLLIEDIDEQAYKIDRILNHLKNANIFNNCHALFIGDIVEKEHSDNKFYLDHVIKQFSTELGLPIFKISNIGHLAQNMSIPLGVDFALIS